MVNLTWTLVRTMLGVALAAGAAGEVLGNNVAATVEGSLLVIAGDNVANQIVVTRNPNGDVVVTGQNGTRVNGVASARFPRIQLNAAELQMGGGNDVVTLRGLQIANDLYVNLGDGANRLTIPAAAPIVVGGNVAIEGGSGTDTIRTEGMIVGLDLSINGGVGVLNATAINTSVGFNVTVIGDAANDVLSLTTFAAGGDVSIETKGGSDRVNVTALSSLLLGISTDANAIAGADRVSLLDVSTVEDIGIFTGPGNDVVQMLDVTSGKNMTVSADQGVDIVSGSNVVVSLDAIFEGGAGSDTFEDYGISGGTKKEVKEFEIYRP